MNEHYACTNCDWLGTLDEAADDCSVGPAATLCPECFSHIEQADAGGCNASGGEECMHYGACFEAGQCVRPPVSLARSAAMPRVPEAAGVVPAVVPPRDGAGALAPACGVSEGTASAQRLNRELPALQSDLDGRN